MASIVVDPTPRDSRPSYWVLNAPGLPCGAQIIGVDQRNPLKYWVDMCLLGGHLPQMYEKAQIYPLTEEDAPYLGLCTHCMGFGDIWPPKSTNDQAPPLFAFARTIDEVHHPCHMCDGTGRPAMRVQVVHGRDEIRHNIHIKPHPYVAPLPNNFYSSLMDLFEAPSDMCLACGSAKNTTYEGQEIHHGEIVRPDDWKPTPSAIRPGSAGSN